MLCILLDKSNDHLYTTGINTISNNIYISANTSNLCEIFLRTLDKCNDHWWRRWIRIIILPNACNMHLNMHPNIHLNANNTNRLILSKKYLLCDVQTIIQCKLKITNNYVNEICNIGTFDILHYIHKNNCPKFAELLYNTFYTSFVSEDGYINLNLIKYVNIYCVNVGRSCNAFDYASANGRTDVLEWLKQHCTNPKYSRNMIDHTSELVI